MTSKQKYYLIFKNCVTQLDILVLFWPMCLFEAEMQNDRHNNELVGYICFRNGCVICSRSIEGFVLMLHELLLNLWTISVNLVSLLSCYHWKYLREMGMQVLQLFKFPTILVNIASSLEGSFLKKMLSLIRYCCKLCIHANVSQMQFWLHESSKRSQNTFVQ